MEFGRQVGQTASRYSVNNFVYSDNEDRKLVLLLAASPNIVELRLETDAFLNNEEISRLPTFKQLRVSAAYLPRFRIWHLIFSQTKLEILYF